MKFTTRKEQRKVNEVVSAILLPLIPHLKEDEADAVQTAITILQKVEVKSEDKSESERGMTREEAKDYIREWCPYDRQEEIIKALEQEPCEDCISRKSVLKIYNEWFNSCNIADKKESPKAQINALPPVLPQQKTEVLNEIKAEIEKRKEGDYACFDDDEIQIFMAGLNTTIDIINKYGTKPKEIKTQDIEMQATEFLAEARACAEKDDDLER